jgi:FkbM family methyltransferase
MVRLKSAQKMALARMAYRLVVGFRRLLGFSSQTVARRHGLAWSLDLAEGIDLSIYLLGRFEPSTVRLYSRLVKPGDTVLDIGANIGAHTLPLAELVGARGRVVAFEPTGYALRKMRANIDLNPGLATRISVQQVMLIADGGKPLATRLYSSWPLVEVAGEVHQDHQGQLMDTGGAVAMTLDEALRRLDVRAVDFIKMDVDGHEYGVLRGGKATLAAHKPPILMELAPYLFDPASRELEGMLELLEGCGYSMADAATHKSLPFDPARLRKMIPAGQSCNVLLQAGHSGSVNPKG